MSVAIIDGLREKTPAVIVFISSRADLLFTLIVQFEQYAFQHLNLELLV